MTQIPHRLGYSCPGLVPLLSRKLAPPPASEIAGRESGALRGEGARGLDYALFMMTFGVTAFLLAGLTTSFLPERALVSRSS